MEDEESETEAIVNQVLDEIGITLSSEVSSNTLFFSFALIKSFVCVFSVFSVFSMCEIIDFDHFNQLVDTPEKGLTGAKKEPSGKVAVPQAEAQVDRELQERLENLRKNN
jgi:hypothetical protein